ncbi:MAG: nucleotidyltransferase domain-containing protein [Thermoplasmata archaeon]|nr:nucleotidyltransferase domain-containing protein [Thermoplasmata archaeon]
METEKKRFSESSNKAIERFKKEAMKIRGVEKIILFGSMARGDFNEDSDIDMLVVWNGKKKDGWKKLVDVSYRILLENDEYISLKILTPGEYRLLKEKHNPFILNVMKEGVTVA